MATTVQVKPEDRAASQATNIRTQYVALVGVAENLRAAMNSTNGFTADQLKTALGADFDTISKALAGIT